MSPPGRCDDAAAAGEIRSREEARALYEQALLEGRGAALLEQERASVFTQEVGNIPSGAEVVAEVIVDLPLRWLEEGAWELRLPTVVAPRYLGAAGRIADAAHITQEVAAAGGGPSLALALQVRDHTVIGTSPCSPSHALSVQGASGGWAVALDGDVPAALDRDVVVRWSVAADARTARRTACCARRYASGATFASTRCDGTPRRPFPRRHSSASPRSR